MHRTAIHSASAYAKRRALLRGAALLAACAFHAAAMALWPEPSKNTTRALMRLESGEIAVIMLDRSGGSSAASASALPPPPIEAREFLPRDTAKAVPLSDRDSAKPAWMDAGPPTPFHERPDEYPIDSPTPTFWAAFAPLDPPPRARFPAAPPVSPARTPEPSALSSPDRPASAIPPALAQASPAPSAGDPRPRGVRQPAAPRSEIRVVYPELSRSRGESGTVLVRATIGVDGRCRAAALARTSGHRALDQAALSAVRGARYLPATVDGRPVEEVSEFNIEFRLITAR